MPPRCKYFNQCHEMAYVIDPSTKKVFCKSHFIDHVKYRVKKTLDSHNLIDFSDPNEKILIALSGGKDSQVLLSILADYQKKYPIFEGLFIDVGVSADDFSNRSQNYIEDLCHNYDIPLNILRVKENVGFSMDHIHQLGKRWQRPGYSQKRKKSSKFRGECAYCGLIKRYYINYYAVKNNFTKVATGHNLTDEVTQLMSNFFNGDIELMSRSGPITTSNVKGLVPRIKPLYYTYESEIILYSYYENIPHAIGKCPYSTGSTTNNLKRSILEIEEFRVGNMFRLLRRYNAELKTILYKKIPIEKMQENVCKQCGMPTYLDHCAFCKTVNRLQEDLQKKGLIKEI